jgi:hypothetical protein
VRMAKMKTIRISNLIHVVLVEMLPKQIDSSSIRG